MTLKMDLSGCGGTFKKAAMVFSNDPNNGSTLLVMKGRLGPRRADGPPRPDK